MTAPTALSVPRFYSFIKLSFFPFIIGYCNYGSLFAEGIKMKTLFTFYNYLSKNQLEFCLDNFSSATVCRSTEYRFPSKREWQLPNAEINFEGCISVKFFKKKKKYKFSKFLLLSLPGILVIKSPKEKEKL